MPSYAKFIGMKRIFILFAILLSIEICDAQVSLTLITDNQLTPNSSDTSGVFCRTFYHQGRDKFYVVYASRALISPPGFNQYYRWEEYDSNFNPTGSRGTLPGVGNGGGDYAMTMVGNNYYHVTGTGMVAWQYRLTKFDEDFNLISSITFPIDSSDSKADMLLNYTNGKLIIGAFHQTGVTHPTMPQQQPSWTPYMHKWEFDTSLVQLGPPVYLNESFTTWGGSCIYNSSMYNVVTFDKWKGHFSGIFNLSVYRYDNNWNYIDSIPLNNDGQWSQGVLWDGTYYYVSYHTGRIHRGGNVNVSIYDVNWNQLYTTQLTNNQIFDTINNLPTLNTIQYNANRPFLTKVNDTLYVSYDQDDYICTDYTPVPQYHEGKRWQAHVAILKINNLTGINEADTDVRFNIYPNPASDQIMIDCNESGLLELFDVTGELLYSQKITKGQTTLPTTNFNKGMYLISFRTGNACVKKEVIIP